MFKVTIGGSVAALGRWPTRTYKLRSSARRRSKQIQMAHDLGIETIWILKETADGDSYIASWWA